MISIGEAIGFGLGLVSGLLLGATLMRYRRFLRGFLGAVNRLPRAEQYEYDPAGAELGEPWRRRVTFTEDER